MGDTLTALVNKLPVDFLMAIIVVLIMATIIYLPRVRRDKNGKLYIFSNAYECMQQRQKKVMSAVDALRKHLTEMDESISECQAWSQRIILFSQSFSLGERIAAGSQLEQFSNSWKKQDHCYNGEARSEYERLGKLQGEVNRNEYFIDTSRPICKHVNGELVHGTGDIRCN